MKLESKYNVGDFILTRIWKGSLFGFTVESISFENGVIIYSSPHMYFKDDNTFDGVIRLSEMYVEYGYVNNDKRTKM
jgi:hypothetical protein